MPLYSDEFLYGDEQQPTRITEFQIHASQQVPEPIKNHIRGFRACVNRSTNNCTYYATDSHAECATCRYRRQQQQRESRASSATRETLDDDKNRTLRISLLLLFSVGAFLAAFWLVWGM